MAIPDFQSLFLPLLKLCADGKGVTKREVLPILANHMGLSEQDMDIKLPSEKQGMFDNRLSVATKESYTLQAFR